MKPDEGIFSELFGRSCDIRDKIAAGEQSRQKRIEPGDLFFLKMPVAVPVTWCAVFPHSKDGHLWYCVPGDSFSLISAADVSSPASTVRSDLNFRCQCGLWVHAEDIDLSNRVDRLDGDEVESIRAAVSELSADPIAILADDAVGSDPDYVEWIDDLRLAIDALLDSLHNEQTHSVRLIGTESAIDQFRQPLSLAADDSVRLEPDSNGSALRQTLQISESVEGRLQARLYDDGVIIEWRPAAIETTTPVVLHNEEAMEWFSQGTFWCTRLIPWSESQLQLSANGEPVAFKKLHDG